MKPCIIYLAQNTSRNEYGRDSRTMLEKSLLLLHENYNDQFQHDVIIFHEGDFLVSDQEEIIRNRKNVQFKEIQFTIPDFLPADEVPETWMDRKGNQYGMGHRHMCRFYAKLIFDILTSMGYGWMMRMDDDSFLHTPIKYNLFDFMKQKGYRYGYRVDILEPWQVTDGFDEAVEAFIKGEKVSPTFLSKQKASRVRKMIVAYEATFMWMSQKLRFPEKWIYPSPLKCANNWLYYNNFYITDLKFWSQPDVQSFLGYMDRIGGSYKYRWNDLIIQSTAVQLFMPREQVFKFTDWTYEHATIKKDKLFWGGIFPAKGAEKTKEVRKFRAKYGRLHTPVTWMK